MNSVNFKKRLSNTPRKRWRCGSASALRERISPSESDSAGRVTGCGSVFCDLLITYSAGFACFKINKAQRPKYSTFDVGRSLLSKFHKRLQSVRMPVLTPDTFVNVAL